MPAQLLALSEGPNILLDKPILLFGRHPECDIQLNSRKVSRRHCCIAQVHDYLVVRDLGSTNGIRINGSRVLEGKLRAGDELTIGNFRYQICWDLPGEGPPPPRPLNGIAAPKPADVNLEEAEEPVPLDENIAVSGILLAQPAVNPPQPPPTSPHATIPEDPQSLIIPDNLGLHPSSGSFAGPSGS